jgi:SOS-response transcriptional repressor LexA
MSEKKIIPIVDDAASNCAGSEPYALMVLGDSMEPEFAEGEIIVIEPDGLVKDGSYVIAWHNEEYIFRQVRIDGGKWYLQPLNGAYPTVEIPGLSAVKGVVIQKKKPGSRRSLKSYL